MFKSISLTTTCIIVSSWLWANPMQPDPIGQTSTSNGNVTPKTQTVARLPRLRNILIIGDYRLAIFNNNTEVQIGESISGYKVINIEPTHVVLKRGDKTRLVELKTTGDLVISPAKED